jgi:hypothetical protein
MSDWPDHAIWWQLHPISFTGAESAARPDMRLPRIEAWLDYLIDLGCNGLALGPVFASESHGYDTVDHYRIDPRLGTGDDFGHLVAQCHERGIRLLLDGVFNHVGRGFPAFQDVLAHGRSSAYASWFVLDWDAQEHAGGPGQDAGGPDKDAGGPGQDAGGPDKDAGGPDEDAGGFRYADFEGHHRLVALNHAEPAVQDYVADVMRHWLDRGADGWRLDAAYAVPPEFWRTVTDRVRRDHPDAWLVGEVLHGHPVRAVEGDLEFPQRPELLRAGLGPRPAQRLRGRLPAADVRQQPRRHPDRQPARGPAAPAARAGHPVHGGGLAVRIRGG